MRRIAAGTILLSTLFASGCTGDHTSASSPTSAPELLRIPYTSQLDQSEREYFVYLPKGYQSEPDRKWPLMLFLHGNGERGNGKNELDFVLMHGPLLEAWVYKRDLPFIIISPQLPMFSLRSNGPDYIRNRSVESIPVRQPEGTPARALAAIPDAPLSGQSPAADIGERDPALPLGWDLIEKDLLAMLDTVQETYRADPNRTYLTGLSYGGFGTWYLGSKHPERFAAIAPVAGWGHPELVEPLAQAGTPVWAFAGGLDPVIPVEYFYPGLNRLKAARPSHDQELRFTVHEDMGHDVWRRVYAGEDFYQWLLQHSSAQ